ncbi:MAG TPA: TIR domain-containing protein, partial [Phototrophicaceae bacterium]|nr:TIR domain-containing protein [Phototrophicaceae bacterium]
MTGSGHIFISYARRDGRLFAERLEQALQVAGFPVWRDSRNLDPWQDFSSELEKAIEASTKVVCCITPDVRREDSFVRRELQYSLNLKKPIVPLLFVDGGWTPIQISTVTHIDFTRQSWDTSLSNLLTRLNYADADDRTYDQVTLPEDPYREYLTALYDQIVDYLNQTVFSLITLRSASTPAAVDAPVPKRASVLPMSFFATAGIQKSETSNSAKTYPHFPAAVDAFDGQVLLLGDPGAGKTTTLFAFARDSVVKRLDDPTQPLPVLAPIATWDAVAQPPLIDWLVEQIPIFNRDELTELIHNNQILLMLDGLDELGSEREDSKSKKSFDPRLNFIKSLKTDFSTVQQMIVSCRVKDYDETGTKIALKGAVTLQPLDDHQMQDYLAEMPALWEALQSDDALREVARTPLLLSLFTFAYREASSQEVQQLRDLQSSPGDVRDKIIETFVRKSYEREARKPFADLPFSLDEVNALLGELAVRDAGKRSDFYRVPTGIVRKILK